MVDYTRLCKQLGYSFKNQNIIREALTHRSVCKSNNERLEYLGDSILNFVIASALFKMFPDAKEGELSRIRSYLVKGDRLTEIAQSLQLGGFLELGPGELKSGGARRASILEDAFEALIGAVYLDSNIIETHRVVIELYTEQFKSIPESDDLKDPKTRLQEYLQARKLPLPEYHIEETSGEQHKKKFTVSCKVEGLDVNTLGIAGSRRKAEQESAEKALVALSNG